ncbi:metal-dependent phosphohydrolase [Citromicrobium phage vB_CbaS-RXM]|nr:metal-dependent phosphohydrolase [Citromicrobium phage vB_CbaS-RXM]
MDTITPGALQIADGTYCNPLFYGPEDVKVEMIAHQLALKCRWNGNTNDLTPECEPILYSVAQHACIVHDIAKEHKEVFVPGADWSLEACPSIYGLHHDDSEGPLIDMPRPLKRDPLMAPFGDIENRVQSMILTVLGVPMSPVIKECVRRIDNAMIFWERDILVGKPVQPYTNEFDHPGGTLHDWFPNFEVWSPSRAKREYLDRFKAWQ